MTTLQPRADRAAWRVVASLLVSTLLVASSGAAEPYREEAVKAAFLHRFTGFVEWPGRALEGSSFRIAVLGAPEVKTELERLLADRQIKGLPVVVTGSAGKAEGRPQMLYIGRGYVGDVARLLAAHRGEPMLVVTDQSRGLEQGGAINFLTVDQRVRIEVSPEPAQKAGLTISSQLLAVAVRVLGGRGEGTQ